MNETYYLNLIEQNTDNTFRVANRIENEILNLKAIEYNTQAIITSGDYSINKTLVDNNYKASVYLGCINLILMITLLISLLPSRKGVLKKK